MAALVWTTSGRVAPGPPASDGSVTVRPTAETMPFVTLPVRPSGLPMASTMSPTASLLESPKVAGCRSGGGALTVITARSSGAYTPFSVAGTGVGLPASRTWNVAAASTTCALVTMLPSVSRITPDPSPRSVVICTTDGSTRCTTET